MYKITRTDYGLHLTVSGLFSLEDAHRCAAELDVLRPTFVSPRSAILDLRDIVPPEPPVLDIIRQILCKGKADGLQRISVIIKSPVVKSQALQLAFLADSAEFVRCINASKLVDWEKLSSEWAIDGIEPDYDSSFDTGHINLGKIKVPAKVDV
jgi:hypothetical protein